MAGSYYYSYLNTAEQIVAHYEGQEPFPVFIKAFFRNNKKFGSRDRKIITHLCYSFFRTGKALSTLPVKERILAGYFLSTLESTDLLGTLQPAWNEKASFPSVEKEKIIRDLDPEFSFRSIFPYADQLSDGIDVEAFCRSHFAQPDVFLRIRPGKEKLIREKLLQSGTAFRMVDENALALSGNAPLDQIIRINRDAVIQDLSSQRTARFFPEFNQNRQIRIWDCCAGSGGKTLLAADRYPDAHITATDNRNTILRNFSLRMKEAGVNAGNVRIMNLKSGNIRSEVNQLKNDVGFDLIIADVPCTGSGTWGRSPEEMYGFGEEEIEVCAELQRTIISNVVPAIRENGYLLYITCSVYKKENEENVSILIKMHNLKLVKQGIIEGYTQRADTMYAALLISAT